MSVKNGRDHQSTPQPLADWAIRRYGLELDVCASPWNAKLPRSYCLERGQDGLLLPWDVGVWCNPPWSNVRPWLERGFAEVYVNGTCPIVVYNLPYRPAVGWWFSLVRPWANHLVEIEGRVTYDPPPGAPKGDGGYEPTVLVVFERRLRAADFNTR